MLLLLLARSVRTYLLQGMFTCIQILGRRTPTIPFSMPTAKGLKGVSESRSVPGGKQKTKAPSLGGSVHLNEISETLIILLSEKSLGQIQASREVENLRSPIYTHACFILFQMLLFLCSKIPGKSHPSALDA